MADIHIPTKLRRPISVLRRPAKSVLPPGVGGEPLPSTPILIRNSKIRLAAGDPIRYQKAAWKTKKGSHVWKTLEITIPRPVVEVAGLEEGMTMVVEGYKDGVVRMFPAGDAMSREEELI